MTRSFDIRDIAEHLSIKDGEIIVSVGGLFNVDTLSLHFRAADILTQTPKITIQHENTYFTIERSMDGSFLAELRLTF